MKSEPPSCRLLILLVVLLVSLTTGELEFYQDAEPDSSDDVNLKNLERFLEAQNHHEIHRPRVLPHLHPPIYEDDLDEYTQQRQKNILEALLENPRILELLQNQKLKNSNYEERPEYNIMNEYPRSIERDDERPFVNLKSPTNRFDEYPQMKLPYADEDPENVYFSSGGRIPVRMDNWPNFEASDVDSLARVQSKVLAGEPKFYNGLNRITPLTEPEPEFTFNFNKPNMNEPSTFAVRPNDRRFYEDDVPVVEEKLTSDHSLHRTEITNEQRASTDKLAYPDQIAVSQSKFSNFITTMPEPQRRAERDPMVISTASKTNNDVYFIAIVAGCSAAAMFALVLISLTWCRLQRGAKAAADIEYPAYGVTGPNKDVSPSGDQRLAHSAQMYHFQHQKQQIIAMEKTAASRDPGSVSEAESDEENEEGDYTVYECPGLAPAGEMEVKNPLFLDDPTPATPHQNHKDEEHQHH